MHITYITYILLGEAYTHTYPDISIEMKLFFVLDSINIDAEC